MPVHTILQVAVPSPLRRLFDYRLNGTDIPNPVSGCRVVVPFGNRSLVGIIVAVSNTSTLPLNKIKPVIKILDSEPLLPVILFETLCWSAAYYQHPLGEALIAAMPQKLRQEKDLYASVKTLSLNPNVAKQLADGAMPVAKKARRQRELLLALSKADNQSLSSIREQGFSSQIIQSLLNQDLIQVSQTKAKALPDFQITVRKTPLALNEEQQQALSCIQQKRDSYNCFLLKGVTGSGKTEVYLQSMECLLEKGKQILVLVPEIGLTPQTVARFETRFDCGIALLHSGLSDQNRMEAWRRAREGSVGIVIGTRSAIFTPLKSPGLIVIDEEHDASFKQQDGFRYSARDLAIVRARNENIPIILGSATPSLESIENANNQKYIQLELKQRAGAAKKPIVELIDIAQQQLSAGFSTQALASIKRHLQSNQQVLVYINRRGFAPSLVCESCGWFEQCKRCDVQLTVHKFPPSLQCHHCGNVRQIPSHCPSCNNKNLTTRGLGTQKSEQLLAAQFPEFPTIRVDRDSTRNKGKMHTLLEQIGNGEPCILVGTQMLAKGHHFPNITLVVILDADAGLFSADFRGQEYMIQTVLQVAGRAGRGEHQGEVLIQSRNTGHRTLSQLAGLDYDQLVSPLLEERKLALMPPYSNIALIRAEANSFEQAFLFLSKLGKEASTTAKKISNEIAIHGPIPSPMERRLGRFRIQLQLRSQSRRALQSLLEALNQSVDDNNVLKKAARKVRWSIDVDPVDML